VSTETVVLAAFLATMALIAVVTVIVTVAFFLALLS